MVPPRPSTHKRPARGFAVKQTRRRHRRIAGWGGAVALAAAIALVIVLATAGSSSTSKEVAPPAVTSGTPDVQAPALQVANPSGIAGVVAYDTTGWPAVSHNGPAAQAMGHTHVNGPVTYSVSPPVGGDHNAVWMNCGVYSQPVPNERAVHGLEHGAVWITYQPSLPANEVNQLRAFAARQSVQGASGSRYVNMSPYPGLSSPIVISSWGYQLKVTAPNDTRLQRFVDTFRNSSTYSPEYGGECTGGVGTPLQK
jgi:hypothetical protein